MLLKVLLLLPFLQQIVSTKYYILSLDSAKYSALLTAEFVAYMEKKAYLIARKDFCINERKDKRLAMYEMFDMISGSETGAIIAATLVMPKSENDTTEEEIDVSHTGELLKNKYWATRSASFFKENVDLLYVDKKMPESLKAFLTFLFLLVVGVLTYKVAETLFKEDTKNI